MALEGQSTQEADAEYYLDPARLVGQALPAWSFNYSPRDADLYALGIGAGNRPVDPKDLQYVYELGGAHAVFPTYPATFLSEPVLQLNALDGISFHPMYMLHREHYLEVPKPLPVEAEIHTTGVVSEVYDMRRGAIVILEFHSKNSEGELVAINRSTAFIRDIGGFGGDRAPAGKKHVAPTREPDAIVEEKTAPNQALIYRLSGDWNPLHADPYMAETAGFERPILHGLCTFGFAARAVLATFGDDDVARFKNIEVRFARHVFPGETLITEMWKESDTRIVFQCKVKERDQTVLTNAAMELNPA